MNTDRLNSWLTLGANIAVLAGLFALVVEIRTNTAAVQAASSQEAVNASRQYLLDISLDEELSRIRQEGGQDLGALTSAESFRFFMQSRGNWIYLQNVWVQNELGVLPGRVWDSTNKIICSIVGQPGWRQDWNSHRPVLDPEFVALVESCDGFE